MPRPIQFWNYIQVEFLQVNCLSAISVPRHIKLCHDLCSDPLLRIHSTCMPAVATRGYLNVAFRMPRKWRTDEHIKMMCKKDISAANMSTISLNGI